MLGKVFLEKSKEVFTTIPGYVVAFDPDAQTAQVQIGINQITLINEEKPFTVLFNVPVCFSGDDFVLEHEIKEGCEGLIHFSQRCIDGWFNTGGKAGQPVIRIHDKNDGFFNPCVKSQPNKITDFANNGIRIRNKSGSSYMWLKSDDELELKNGAGFIKLNPDGSVNINGAIIGTDGNLTTASGISVNTHVHGGVTPGSGNSGGPL
jgi:hypothetical protein